MCGLDHACGAVLIPGASTASEGQSPGRGGKGAGGKCQGPYGVGARVKGY